MVVGRNPSSRLIALTLPAAMLWVFFACALACVAVGESGCEETEPLACCRPVVEEDCHAIALTDTGKRSCYLVPDHPVVLVAGGVTSGRFRVSGG